MKNTFFIIIFFSCSMAVSQDTLKTFRPRPFAVFLESPVFYGFNDGKFHSWVLTVNLEYLLKASENYGISFSAGYGRDFRLSKYIDNAYNFGINNIFGKRHHFIEVGTGLGVYSGDVYHNFRFGYRLHLFDRLMFRAAYTPYLRLWSHTHSFFDRENDITVSLGYRFGVGNYKSKRKNDPVFGNAIHSIQLNFQPLFGNFDKKTGHLESLNCEILLSRLNRTRVLFETGFGMAVIYRKDYSSEEIVIPVGLNVLIGENRHFAEFGINYTWRFEYRYYILEPKAGYRIYFWKHFTAHLLYSPYFWLSNKENKAYITNDFVHSLTVGLGYKF